jgi:glycosyltransferase involved in cell wall biosynthesis
MPRVSVIMPIWNHAEHVGEAIESLLHQTRADWELIIVDDGSTDDSAAAVRRFDDDRIRYVFQRRAGVSSARNAGLELATGAYIAFLDADDRYHPQKLEDQLAHFARNPDVGGVYCARIDIDRQGGPLRLHRSPSAVSVRSLVLGFPFAPGEVAVRSQWLERVGGFDPSLVENEDRDLFLRLVLAGCRFAGSNRFHSYRRRYEDKFFGDLPRVAANRRTVLDRVFEDARCPRQARAVRREAYRRTYLECALRACVQQETELAESYFAEAWRFSPRLRSRADLVDRFVEFVTRPGGDHEPRLRAIFAQLPPPLARLRARCDAAVGRGYLILGALDTIFGRLESGRRQLDHAARLGATSDVPFRSWLQRQLDNHAIAVGREESERARRLLAEAGIGFDPPPSGARRLPAMSGE